WGTKVNYRTFEFAIHSPKEALASSGSSPLLLSFTILFALIIVAVFLARIIINWHINRKGHWLGKFAASLLLAGLTVLSIRGGFQDAPMNESMAYYSTDLTLNYAAVNTEWGLATDIKNAKYNTKNPYAYFSRDNAQQTIAVFYEKPDSAGLQVLTTARPNVVLIIMESHTGNVVESLGGEPGISNSIER